MEDSPVQEAPEKEKAETKEEGRKPSVLAELKAWRCLTGHPGPKPMKRRRMPDDHEELNTALYKKMFAEQEKFKGWLLTQPPEKILDTVMSIRCGRTFCCLWSTTI